MTRVGGYTVHRSSTITRPADTTAYAAGDAMTDSTSAPTVASITNAARNSGWSGVITSAKLIDSGAPATAGEFEVWIFDTTFTADNDNSAFTPTDAECLTVVRIIPFPSYNSYVGTASGNRVYQADSFSQEFVCGATTTSLFWALVCRNAYTPISAETFTLRLGILQD
jgi:hypothetical protein